MESKENHSKNKKIWLLFLFLILIILIILILGGYIIYIKTTSVSNGKVTDSTKAEKNTKDKVVQKKWDLSLVPTVGDSCTFRVTKDELNSKNLSVCDGKLTKYVVTDVVVDNIIQDVQLIYYDNQGENSDDLKSKSGMYLDGKRVFDGFNVPSGMIWVNVYIHNNLLFALIDGGTSITGYVNILSFDKNGSLVYNLSEALQKENVTSEYSSNSNQVVSTGDILRDGSFVITDNKISFKSYMSQGVPCINGYRGSIYTIDYKGTKFGKITSAGGWNFDNDNCSEAFN